jgi:hypothetical protein
VAVEGVTPILNVSSIAAAVAWFESLGWQQAVREVHLQHPDGHTFRVGCGLEAATAVQRPSKLWSLRR